MTGLSLAAIHKAIDSRLIRPRSARLFASARPVRLVPSHRDQASRDTLETKLIHGSGIVIIKAIVHKADDGGFWAEVPSVPGCATQAETIEELRSNLLEAI